MNLSKPQRLLEKGNPAKALALLPSRGAAADPRIEILRARIAEQQAGAAEAESVLAAASSKFPQNAPVALFRGIYLLDDRRPAEARDEFRRVVALQPKNQLAESYLGLALLESGDSVEGHKALLDSGFTDNHMFRVRLAEWMELEWLKSGRFFSDRLAAVPEDKKSSARTALRNFYKRRFPQMAQALGPPGTADELVCFLGGIAHEMLFHYSLAGSYLQPLLDKAGADGLPEPLAAATARMAIRRGEFARGAKPLSEILILGPEDYGINYYLGVVCLAYGRKQEARRQFVNAFTSYAIDTQEFQWWQILHALKLERDADVGTEEQII